MLLRDTNPSDFRVPTTPRRAIAADDAKAKADRVGEEALRRRDKRDTGLALSHERARARAELLQLFADEERPPNGFVARADDALKRYKSSPDALRGEDLKALERDVRGHAIRLEAMARARDRVVQVGKTLDTLIEATRAAPQNFAAHAEAARETIDRLRLPEKAAAAFRARLPEIAETALLALIDRDPDHAATLLKSSEGPASAECGLDRATRRVLAKHAAGAAEERKHTRATAANVEAMRAHADAADAIAAAERGDGDETGLFAWLARSETLGPAATRALRRQCKAAAKTVARRKAAVAAVRDRLARGEPPDVIDEEGIDGAYAALHPVARVGNEGRDRADAAFAAAAGTLPAPVVRRIVADMKSGDAARAMRAATFVVALEEKDAGLVARLPKTVVREAHQLAAAGKAGFSDTDAANALSTAADVDVRDRDRRTREFDRAVDGAALARAIEHAFAVKAVGIADA